MSRAPRRTTLQHLPGDGDFRARWSRTNPLAAGQRLWSKVRGPWSSGVTFDGQPFAVTDDDCWVWEGDSNAGGWRTKGGRRVRSTRPGYGRIRWQRADGSWTLTYVHVLAYRLVKGEFPAGHEIDHTCRNTRCVNPRHLDVVTPAENVRRAYARRRDPEVAAT